MLDPDRFRIRLSKAGILRGIGNRPWIENDQIRIGSAADPAFAFKAKLLRRDPHCFFAIDSRATFSFERALEWNYSIIEAQAAIVPAGSAQYTDIREAFIAKNPWEVAFFTLPDLEMYHLKSKGIVCPGNPR